MKNPMQPLHEAGQAVWLDFVDLDLQAVTGDLVEDGVQAHLKLETPCRLE